MLGCVALTAEAEALHHPAAILNLETDLVQRSPAGSGPALPMTGGGDTAIAAGELMRPQPLSPDRRHEALKAILAGAAIRHGLDPGLVMAVAWWESGWDMTKVSSTGAIGMMQVDPATAHDLGPKLLGRPFDVELPYDNADLGAAVLKADLDDAGGDLTIALASYYEGSGNVDASNLDPGAQTYVDGVTSLQKAFDSGAGPA